MRKGIVLLFIVVCGFSGAKSQSIQDTSLLMNMLSFHVSGHLPGGDLANQYGMNIGVGGGYTLKTAGNWILGAEYTFFSGNEIKKDSIFSNLWDEYGDFINIYGEIGEVTLYERGFYAGLKAGRLFPVIGPNPNSGIFVTVSAGLLQHKTLIHQDGRDIPSIIDNYSKGYDRLTNGFALSEFIGYMHLDNNDPVNFYFGFDFHQAWTQNRRDWNFDLMGPDLTKRQDFLFGFRFGWIFPINKKTTDTYYFY